MLDKVKHLLDKGEQMLDFFEQMLDGRRHLPYQSANGFYLVLHAACK